MTREQELEEALTPFVQHMSSDECITVQLRNEWIAQGRRLLTDAEKCDGNHGGPACSDPHCWQRDEPWPWPNTNHCDGNHAPPPCGAADCLHSAAPVVQHPLYQAVWPYEASEQPAPSHIDAVFAKYAGANDNGTPYLRTYIEGFRNIARDILAAQPAAQEPSKDTPPWMQGMAHNIADEYNLSQMEREQLERDIINAMKESAREVALYFAAQVKDRHA
jgi:hypothetical protein